MQETFNRDWTEEEVNDPHWYELDSYVSRCQGAYVDGDTATIRSLFKELWDKDGIHRPPKKDDAFRNYYLLLHGVHRRLRRGHRI